MHKHQPPMDIAESVREVRKMCDDVSNIFDWVKTIVDDPTVPLELKIRAVKATDVAEDLNRLIVSIERTIQARMN